ncbi:hypothetical protein D0Y65_002627 [Glycine soja]|uniref:Uncharacterized protein n=1 Tax=Glycine soja TaxID=3848 RepID=A0A445LHY2_GLYSO|nr:hypothetical protein D0Y65_002627 [Glycine soja]RZC22850.1 hypothetical protein D0Y65_002627 [Glycine soja]RZC22851.1 hypothetical protein D0Y65_002627 [Glycine soja]RZC22852.1 hypothetical protein D0Y65_002627 [Glycine soja]
MIHGHCYLPYISFFNIDYILLCLSHLYFCHFLSLDVNIEWSIVHATFFLIVFFFNFRKWLLNIFFYLKYFLST